MNKRIALVTCSKYPRLTESDRLLAGALKTLGVHAVATDWRDSGTRWGEFDLAVLRSTWDYHLHPEEFSGWLDLAATATRLLNPLALVRWNMNKRYLVELAARGVPTLPSIVVAPGDSRPPDLGRDRACSEIVVKPLIGASAWQISRIRSVDWESALTPELRRNGCLIQPYAPEIAAGEYSIVFFGGVFSHAVLKKPKAGDFRTQPELGATHTLISPKPSLIADAAAVLDVLPQASIYARIDGIVRDNRLLLMEAELIEPDLYFEFQSATASTFGKLLLASAR